MANQGDIKQYLMEGENSYFKQDNRNGEILMLSGVWGSGKTHFWKNEVEKELVQGLKEKDKSYVFISLYGKDSIEELQNEIYSFSYNLSTEDDNKVISSACSVFTEVTSFMPKVSIFGIEVELDKSAEKVEAENNKQKMKKGIESLMNGGVICFDYFERKSSKIDLNDLFGFITNLTEVFKTKTVIITNQEFFKENDSEVFSRIKEKSVNKFLLLNPTVDELFETIYKEKYSALDEYKDKILEAIKITEEKNARIFIQVLDNCLEYQEQAKEEREIFILVLITIVFVKYNLILRLKEYETGRYKFLLPSVIDYMPSDTVTKMMDIPRLHALIVNKEDFLDTLKKEVSKIYAKKDGQSQTPSEKLKDDLKYIDDNSGKLFQIYKYCIGTKYFEDSEIELINKISNFVESGILLDSDV
ncbi:hypothetical protein [Sulfurimonas sp.]|uniref:hypothetical protein n=1 Tax=Sulfurimonas sp. TaxID=2022749 RepID=UPI0025F8BED9|nr:hypothetical protein [Sulfurimonas sp.]